MELIILSENLYGWSARQQTQFISEMGYRF